MERIISVNAAGSSFSVPLSIIERLSPTLQSYLLSNQKAQIDLRGSRFTTEVISVIRRYFEVGGELAATNNMVAELHNDDHFVAVARAADELGLAGLLSACTCKLMGLLSDPRFGVHKTREFFRMSLDDPDEPVTDTDSADHLTRSTFFGGPTPKEILRDFSRAVLLSKRESASTVSESACFLCQKSFTTFDRRHHCRACARPVCGACSLYVELPRGYTPVAPQSYLTLAVNYLDYSKHLICRQCEFCIDFGVLDLDIVLLMRAASVNKKWHQAALNYGREMLDIQYKLPYVELSYRERRRLWTNREYWVGHSKWSLQMLKSVDWHVPEIANAGAHHIQILAQARRQTSCHDIWCSTRCSQMIDAGDALELLSEGVTNELVRGFAVECLRKASDDRLACYLPMLVNNLRWEPTPSSSTLWHFLLEKAFSGTDNTVHSEFCNQLYWALHLLGDGDRRLISLQQRLLIEIARKFGDRYALQLVRGLDFVNILESMPTDATRDDIRAHLQRLLPRLGVSRDTPFRMPLDPSVQIVDFLVDDVRVEQSSTRPIVLPCRRLDGSTYHLMFKREDLRKDWVVVNVIRFMSSVLRENGLPLNILTYRVLPTGRTSGFIEIVPDADTIYNIEVKHRTTLQKYILDRNRDGVVGAIFDRFSSSMAGYSLACYVLALGDRHKNNIMLRTDGTLFHIDYGYILGKDAALKSTIAPYMRITPEMKEAMGGEDSAEYRLFQERCLKGLSILRRYAGVFVNMLMFLVNASPPVVGESLEQLRSIINDRFRPDALPTEAAVALRNAMERSNNATGGKVVDTFHRIAKASGMTFGNNSPDSVTEKIKSWWSVSWGGNNS